MKYKPPKTTPSTAAVLAGAKEAASRGRVAEAEALIRKVLERQPKNLEASFLLAGLAAGTGRSSLARQILRAVVDNQPDSVEALLQLANLVRNTRAQEEAKELCLRAIALEPENAEAYIILGICFSDQWQTSEAVATLKKAVEYRPDFWQAFDRLGYALDLDGRPQEAVEAYRKSIELMPTAPNSYVNLGNLLEKEGLAEEAAALYQKTYEVSANSAGKLLSVAKAQLALANTSRAEDALYRAVELDETAEGPRLLLSKILQESGRFAEAQTQLDSARKFHPNSPFVFREIVYSAKVTSEQLPLIEAMRQLIKRSPGDHDDFAHLHYALGKAYDDLGEYGKAINHFHEANRMASPLLKQPYRDRKAYSDLIDHIIENYSADALAAYDGPASETEEPVFVLGMPRSGTTLTEQIVSSHPSVAAVGELLYLPTAARRLAPDGSIPGATQASELIEGYLRRLRATTQGEARITDKMPENYLSAGLIHALFPNARIIHCRRNPIDTCLSIYVTPITVSFSHSLSDIAFAYHQYQRLMDHWRRVLPADRFLESDYEEIVTNPEPLARRLIEFIGLDWDDAVLLRDSGTRTIKTASRWQVRQPLHRSSVERWRRYEPWIGELIGAFSELTSSDTSSEI